MTLGFIAGTGDLPLGNSATVRQSASPMSEFFLKANLQDFSAIAFIVVDGKPTILSLEKMESKPNTGL